MPNYKFEVRLENVELTKTQVKEINTAINALVGKAVVAGAANRGIYGTKLQLNPEWLGIWLKKFATLDALKISKTFKPAKIAGV